MQGQRTFVEDGTPHPAAAAPAATVVHAVATITARHMPIA